MATKKKMLQAAAGNTGGAGPDVEDVFSTYLYTGTASNQTITNGIDLSGEGGLVWIKGRTNAQSHGFFDTERGVNKALASDANWAEFSYQGVNAFNSNGFQVGYQNEYNQFTLDYASWTFRKAPKFFDVVTWTGDGTGNRVISHSLNSTPGMVVVRPYDTASDWFVNHRGNGTAGLKLNTSDSTASAPVFSLGGDLQWDANIVIFKTDFNNSGVNYVAYLFAHNDGDGEFGPDGDADIIKCGSYTGNGSLNGPEIDLGFEPQWLLVKRSSTGANWLIIDNMRGFVATDNNDSLLYPNLANAEASTNYYIQPTPTGFQPVNSPSQVNASGSTYIYMAIRRGTKVPESATEAFDIQSLNYAGPYSVGFPTDLLLVNNTGGSSSNTYVGSRLIGGDKYLRTSSTAAEGTSSGIWSFDLQDSFTQRASPSSPWLGYHWKRAPGYFDAVAYTGDGVAGRTVSHNLGVAPEMIWTAKRSSSSGFKVLSPNQALLNLHAINSEYADSTTCQFYGDNSVVVSPTDTNFTVGTLLNNNATTFISYLFASLPGISKVGSASHSGTTNVDCGFTSGARFVLLKRTDASGDWYVWDSVRGIVSGNDPYLLLNSTAAQVTTTDYIDPLASGFTITSNFTAGDYIFYAIA